jgi:hypothetical protein
MKPNESLVSDAARPVSNQALERRLTFRSESGARFANGACRSLRSLLVSALCIRLVPAVPKGVASKKIQVICPSNYKHRLSSKSDKLLA